MPDKLSYNVVSPLPPVTSNDCVEVLSSNETSDDVGLEMDAALVTAEEPVLPMTDLRMNPTVPTDPAWVRLKAALKQRAVFGKFVFQLIGTGLGQTDAAIKEGDIAPNFSLPDQNGDQFDLYTFLKQGKCVVLYFYCSDFSPGCYRMAQCFTRQLKEFSEAGAEVIGLSINDQQTHNDFHSELNLGFRLLSDKGNYVRRRYGVPDQLPFALVPGRATYVIDPSGVVRRMLELKSPFGAENKANKFVAQTMGAVKGTTHALEDESKWMAAFDKPVPAPDTTLLHAAMVSKNTDGAVVDALIASGIDLLALNEKGQTPLDLAIKFDCVRVFRNPRVQDLLETMDSTQARRRFYFRSFVFVILLVLHIFAQGINLHSDVFSEAELALCGSLISVVCVQFLLEYPVWQPMFRRCLTTGPPGLWGIINILFYSVFAVAVLLQAIPGVPALVRGRVVACHIIITWLKAYSFLRAIESVGLLLRIVRLMIRDLLTFVVLAAVALWGLGSSAYVALKYSSPLKSAEPFFFFFGSFGGSSGISPDTMQDFGVAVLLYVLAMVVVTLLLANLLIAMFSQSYNNVQSEAQSYWLLEKAELTLSLTNINELSPIDLATNSKHALYCPEPYAAAGIDLSKLKWASPEFVTQFTKLWHKYNSAATAATHSRCDRPTETTTASTRPSSLDPLSTASLDADSGGGGGGGGGDKSGGGGGGGGGGRRCGGCGSSEHVPRGELEAAEQQLKETQRSLEEANVSRAELTERCQLLKDTLEEALSMRPGVISSTNTS